MDVMCDDAQRVVDRLGLHWLNHESYYGFLNFLESFETLRADSPVVEEWHEASSRGVRRGMDASTILHACAKYGERCRDPDEPPEAVMCQLLAVGLNPDVMDEQGRRPMHRLLARGPELSTVIALAVCRPRLPDAEERAELLLRQDQPEKWREICAYFEKLEADGFPSLAQLAHEKRWYAVKNLLRRRILDRDELLGKWRGMDARQWAALNGEDDLADEIDLLSWPTPASEAEKMNALVKVHVLEEPVRKLKYALENTKKSFLAELALIRDEIDNLKRDGGSDGSGQAAAPPSKFLAGDYGWSPRTPRSRYSISSDESD